MILEVCQIKSAKEENFQRPFRWTRKRSLSKNVNISSHGQSETDGKQLIQALKKVTSVFGFIFFIHSAAFRAFI